MEETIIANRLITEGRRILEKPKASVKFTDDTSANNLLNDLEQHPGACLIGQLWIEAGLGRSRARGLYAFLKIFHLYDGFYLNGVPVKKGGLETPLFDGFPGFNSEINPVWVVNPDDFRFFHNSIHADGHQEINRNRKWWSIVFLRKIREDFAFRER